MILIDVLRHVSNHGVLSSLSRLTAAWPGMGLMGLIATSLA